jgi:LmbE family N-acetylglucosaminyl deacetylase
VIDRRPVDLLIFAPHPDDESVGAGGIIQHAVAAGKTVRVVFITSGDGYPQAMAARLKRPVDEMRTADFVSLASTRQLEAVAAATILGLRASDLVFLGYPDGALTEVYANESRSGVESPFTALRSTYGPAVADYHTSTHGRPGAYTRRSLVADATEILHAAQPAQIYVTDQADTHPDHEATFNVVTEAAAEAGYSGERLTMVVHSGPVERWPWPAGATASSGFEPHAVDGTTYPMGVSWPPPVRVPLTAAQCAVKLQAIAAHASQYAVDRDYLEAFVKAEELFWRPRQAL